jgi:hypothetical protein
MFLLVNELEGNIDFISRPELDAEEQNKQGQSDKQGQGVVSSQ